MRQVNKQNDHCICTICICFGRLLDILDKPIITYHYLVSVAWIGSNLVYFLLNVFGVGVSCRNLYSFVVNLNVNGSGSITLVGEERANLSAVVYL